MIRRRHPVESTNLRSVGYDPATATLEVEFCPRKGETVYPGHVGPLWRYAPVPPETFAELLNAESIGSYFAREVKPRWRGERVERATTIENTEEPPCPR